MSLRRGSAGSRGLDVVIYGVGPLVLLIAAGWSVERQADWDAENTRLTEVPLDGVARAEARRTGAPDPEGAPLLPGFPSRETQQSCPEGTTEARCAGARAVARFYPPSDAVAGRAAIRSGGEAYGLSLPPARSLLVVSWYAGFERSLMTPEEIRVLAAAEATMLGAPPGGDQPVERLLSGIEDLRWRPYPNPDDAPPARVLPTYSRGEVPPSIDLGAAVLARTTAEAAAAGVDPAPPLASYAAYIRRGEEPPAAAWQMPGVAGLIALEVGRAQRSRLIPSVCAMVANPPTVADQLAGLWVLDAMRVVPLPRGCEVALEQLARLDEAAR